MATRKLFQSIKDELVDVDVEGWQAVALRTSLELLQERETIQSVHLLPLFDAYTLGLGRDLESLLPKAYKSRVFRPQGWISAVVLVDGAMQGVWEHTSRAAQTVIKVHMFSSPSARVRDGIVVEADRLAAFLNTNVTVVYD
jgi:hypothetical protein